MVNLREVKEDFIQNKIAKPDYIKKMYEIHSRLFEYAEFINNTDISKVEILENQVIMTTKEDSIKLICPKEDTRSAPLEILNFNQYEAKELYWITHLIKKNFATSYNFFDIGANIGFYSLKIAKKFPKSKVYAFEPISNTYNILNRNIQINSLHNIELFNFGFSNISKEAMFYYSNEESASASLANITDRENVKRIPAKLKTIDEFIEEKTISIDFIKCDVEGAEFFVFQGGLKTLKRDKPIIFSEMLRKWAAKFNYSPNKIIETLREIGYECYRILDKELVKFTQMTEETVETNFFFLDPKKHKIK